MVADLQRCEAYDLNIICDQMRENPVISDWVRGSGGSTEGLLGGRLAQRQAALRGLMAAGARSTFGFSVRADALLSTSCATKRNFWKRELIRR